MSAKGVQDAGTASSLGSEAVPAKRPQARERPILFKAPMVRALLAGTKTQTRRIMDPQPEPMPADVGRMSPYDDTGYWWSSTKAKSMVTMHDAPCMSPYGYKGDRLWVKETWRPTHGHGHGPCECSSVRIAYAADGGWKEFAPEAVDVDWKIPKAALRGKNVTPLFMPRWASRITLEVTGVRVERLQDVSEEDAEAEGVASLDGEIDEVALCAKAKAMGLTTDDARAWFATLWGSINGDSAWDANPWVWVISFRRLP